MATAAAELFVKVSADIKGLTSGMDKAARAADNLGKETKSAAADVGSLTSSMGGLKAAAAGVGLVAVAGGIAMLGKRSIDLAAELEQAKIGFTTMLGGAQQADAFLRELTQFAATTPFELRGLTDSSKKLLAFGFDAKAIIPIMTSVGNAVAGLGGGKDTLDGVTRALGQMAAKGKVSAEEMNQLAERGIPAWKMLADGIGVSIPKAMKMAEGGAIDANKAIVAIVNGMNEKFPDMMQKQSQSFSGAMSNLQDSADIALTKIGTKLMEALRLTDIIKALSAGISNLTDAFIKGGLLGAMDRAFGPAAKAAIVGFGAVVVASATPAIVALGSAMVAAAASAAPLIATGVAIAAAAYPIIKNWDALKNTIVALFETGATYAAAWYNRATRVFSDFASMAGDAIRYVGDWIRNTFGVDIAAKLGVGLAKASKAFGGFKQMAVEGLGVVVKNIKATGNSIAADFTQAFRGGAVAVRASMGKVTAEMLGLKAATQDASKAAKSKAKALKEAETAARKAEAAFARLTKVNQQSYDRFEAMARSLTGLNQRLKDVDLQASRQGRSFDIAGAKAEAYKGAIGAIESAFGKMSPQASSARLEMERLARISESGAKDLADAFGVIDKGQKGLEAAARKAALMGKEFDQVNEAVTVAEQVMGQLIDRGLEPGNVAFDEAARNLANVRKAADEAKTPMDQLKDAAGNLASNMGSLGSNLKIVVDTLGIEGLAPVVEAINKFGQFGSAIVSLVGNMEGLHKAAVALFGFFNTVAIPAILSAAQAIGVAMVGAVKALTVVIVANPIGAIVAGVVALTLAGLALWENWDYVSGELGKAWDWMAKGALAAFGAIGAGVNAIWDGITSVVKGSVNAMISLVNLLIRGMNRISIDMPSWVPNVGGLRFGVNIPQVPYLATGGVVTNPTMARLGEGGRPEAVLPLNENIYRQIGQGIASARGGGGTQVIVNYNGNGKWTREDAQGLGRLLVSELRTMGVRA